MGQGVKNPLRAQSKYGLMGSSAKTGKIFFWGSQEHFLHKSAIWDRTPPTYTSNAVYMCAGGFKGPKSSNGIQLSWFVQSYCNSSDLGFLGSGGVGQVGGGCLRWSTIVYIISGRFRGREPSHRIEISWLVQDLLNFGVLGSLQLWEGAGGWGCLGAWGCHHRHVHTHIHRCTHAHMHV